MSELQQPLIPKETGSESPVVPVLLQSEATVGRQPFAEARFQKVLKELEVPIESIAKNLESESICSCPCRLGLIAGLEDGSVVLVNYEAEVRLLGKHEGKVRDLCTATDVVVYAGDQTVHILSLEGKHISAVEHPSQVYCVSISSDAKHVVSGSDDHAVRIWGVEERKLLAILEGHSESVCRVAISPDGQYIVSGSMDCTLRIWSIEEQKQLASLEGHNTRINSVLISSDGKHIVSTSNENEVRVWSLEERKPFAVLEGHTYPVSCILISSDGKHIVSGSSDCSVRIWSIEERKQQGVLSGHSSNVNCIAISPDGKQIIGGSHDKSVRIWDLEERRKLAVLEGHTSVVSNISISQDGKRVITISQHMVRVWKLEHRTQFDVLEGHTDNVVSVLPYGKHLVSGSYDMTLRIWDMERRTQVAVLEGHKGWVYCLSMPANEKLVASASRDKTVRIWDLEVRREYAVLEHASFVYCVSFSPDGKHVVSGTGDGTVQIWDIEEKALLAVLEGHSNIVWCVSISPDGRFIVSGSWDSTLRVWDFARRKLLAVLEGHTSNVRCVSISTDGKYIISGSSDQTVRIWDFEGRKQLAVLEGYSAGVNSVAMSSDGRHILTGSHDKTLRIWDFEERKEVGFLEGHSESVQCISITTDGRHVISGSKDKTIRIADVAMILPALRSDFLRANLDNKEPSPSRTYYFCGKYHEYLKQGVPIASSVAASPILPHYFNSLHICAYYSQSTALKDYLEKDVPIIKGVFGSPLTVALTKSSTKCVNIILQHLINKFERNQGFLVLQEIVEDFPKLLLCNASSLFPFFNTLLGASIQSLPEYIVPLRQLPCALFQTQQFINLSDFAKYEGSELLTGNGELVKFWTSRFNWNFALGSAESLEFLRALENCEDRHVLTTPLVDSLIQSKWETLLLMTRTHTSLYVCLLISLVCLTFNYFRHDVLSVIFIFLNVLFMLYEVVESLANGSDYWVDPWNYVDLTSGLTSVTWGYLVFSDVEEWHYLQFVVVSSCFLRGFTFFRTFQMTRIFVRMVIEVVKEMYAFLVILAYSTVSCGMMYAVLLPGQIAGAPEAWTTAYELLMGTYDNTDFDLLKWLCFTAASLMNVIIMLNLLISILGDAYEKAQMSASEHDNLEMLKIVIEYESMLFWRRKAGQSSVMIVCKSAEEEDLADEWAGRVDNIKKALEKNMKDTETLLLKKLDTTEKNLKDTELRLLKKLDATEKNRKDDESASSKKLEKKVEESLTAMEERLEAARIAMETKIDQVLAALQASH